MLQRWLSVVAVVALAAPASGVFQGGSQNKRLVLNVNFETAKDYDITSAYAVRGWNTTEGHMYGETIPTPDRLRERRIPVASPPHA